MDKAKVLVINAIPGARATLATTLAGEGWDVVTAGDMASGENLLTREHFDFVLLGLTAGSEEEMGMIRKLAALSAGRGILVAARGADGAVVEALRQGVLSILDDTPPAGGGADTAEEAAAFDARLGRARRSLEQGKIEQAMVYISQAVVISPDRPEIFNLIGAIKEMRGDVDAARRMYRVAVTVDPAFVPARQNLERTCGWRYDAAKINLGDFPPENNSWRI